jgi:hypothetical protein
MFLTLRAILLSVALFAGSVLLFSPTTSQGFLNWDDDQYVQKNPLVTGGVSASGAIWAFTTIHASNWHPLTWLSLQLDSQLFGPKPTAYHTTNLLLHAASAVLLFLTLQTMTRRTWLSFLAAAFFAVHPLRVESVAWIAERKDVLSTFFWMSTCLAYGWYALRPGWLRYLVVLFSFALGLLAKPMLVTLPFILLLLDYWPLNRLDPSASGKDAEFAGRTRARRMGFLVMEKLPFFLLAAGSCVVTWYAQQHGLAIKSLEELSLPERMVNAVLAYCTYIRQLIWPASLGLFYPLIRLAGKETVEVVSWQVISAALLLLAMTFFTRAKGRRFPYFLVGWFWYLGTLVPVIGLVQVGGAAHADRYTYIPMVGLLIALLWGAADLACRWRTQQLAFCLAVILLMASGITTLHQLQYWQNNIVLWKHTLEVCGESTVAYANLANALMEQGLWLRDSGHRAEAMQSFHEAEKWFRREYELDPSDPLAAHGLALSLSHQGKTEPAIEQYRVTLKLSADWARAHYNLAVALTALGQRQRDPDKRKKLFDDAVREYEEVIRCGPLVAAAAHARIGELLRAQGKFDEALRQFQIAVDGGAIIPSEYLDPRRISTATSRQLKDPAHLSSE